MYAKHLTNKLIKKDLVRQIILRVNGYEGEGCISLCCVCR